MRGREEALGSRLRPRQKVSSRTKTSTWSVLKRLIFSTFPSFLDQERAVRWATSSRSSQRRGWAR